MNHTDLPFESLPDQGRFKAKLPQDEQYVIQQLQTHPATDTDVGTPSYRRRAAPERRAITPVLLDPCSGS